MRGIPARPAATVAIIGAVALIATACGGPEPISSDSAIFDGLDPATVTETLATTHAVGWIDSQPAEDRERVAQLMAWDLQQCRAAVADLAAWSDGWSADSLHLVRPERPLDPDDDSAGSAQELLVRLVQAQGRDGIVAWLSLDAGCSEWVPATVGDDGAPTIAETLDELADHP